MKIRKIIVQCENNNDILQIIEVVQDINNANIIVINILFVMSNDNNVIKWKNFISKNIMIKS